MNDNAYGFTTDEGDEGLHGGARWLVGDRELDRLAEAELAWERWERTRRWWLLGSIDDAAARDAG